MIDELVKRIQEDIEGLKLEYFPRILTLEQAKTALLQSNQREADLLAEIERLKSVLSQEADYCQSYADKYRGVDEHRADRPRADRLKATLCETYTSRSAQAGITVLVDVVLIDRLSTGVQDRLPHEDLDDILDVIYSALSVPAPKNNRLQAAPTPENSHE